MDWETVTFSPYSETDILAVTPLRHLQSFIFQLAVCCLMFYLHKQLTHNFMFAVKQLNAYTQLHLSSKTENTLDEKYIVLG